MNKEAQKIIDDLNKGGISVFKSPMGYYTIKTKRFSEKLELIKEVQRIILNSDYSVTSAMKVGDFMKKNLETSQEWLKKNKGQIDKMMKETIDKAKIKVKKKSKK